MADVSGNTLLIAVQAVHDPEQTKDTRAVQAGAWIEASVVSHFAIRGQLAERTKMGTVSSLARWMCLEDMLPLGHEGPNCTTPSGSTASRWS